MHLLKLENGFLHIGGTSCGMIFKMESQMLLNGLVGLSSFGSWVGKEVTSVNFFWKLNLVLTRRQFVVKSRQNMHVGMQLKPLVSAMGVYIISPRHYNSGGECFNNWKPLRIQQWGPVCLYKWDTLGNREVNYEWPLHPKRGIMMQRRKHRKQIWYSWYLTSGQPWTF